MVKSKTYIAIPPGTTIKEQLINHQMTQKEFSTRMDMSEKHISKLINGEVNLTYDVANRLELVLGIPASFWNNLEANYRETILKAQNENDMENDILISRQFPYSQLVKLNWLNDSRQVQNRVVNLRKFFEVVNLSLVNSSSLNRIACRRQNETEKADYALLAWAQKAKLEARNIKVKKINITLLISLLDTIKSLSCQPPEQFCAKLVDLLAECGIAIVFLPHIKGSYLHGATFYDQNKIVVGLTVRGKDEDKFWFSLFHELAHIIKGHINNPNGTSENDEIEADEFAKNTLISPQQFQQFISDFNINTNNIINYAATIGISPGILVGRLQKEKYISFSSFNNLKQKYQINE